MNFHLMFWMEKKKSQSATIIKAKALDEIVPQTTTTLLFFLFDSKLTLENPRLQETNLAEQQAHQCQVLEGMHTMVLLIRIYNCTDCWLSSFVFKLIPKHILSMCFIRWAVCHFKSFPLTESQTRQILKEHFSLPSTWKTWLYEWHWKERLERDEVVIVGFMSQHNTVQISFKS